MRNTNSQESIDLQSPDAILLPGDYTIIPKESSSPQLCVTAIVYQIIPRRKSAQLQSPSPSPSPGQSPRQERKKQRNHSFRESIIGRDSGACVMSGRTKDTIAAHIIAFAYSNNANQSFLPDHIKEVIRSWKDGIDDVRNGLLLSPDFSAAFDKGRIAIKYDRASDEYIVIAIEVEFQYIDSKRLWQKEYPSHCLPPHPDLLDFNLQYCVMEHMRGSAEYKEDFNDPDSD